MTDEIDDRYLKLYVGQAQDLWRRIRHHRSRLMKGSKEGLHYKIAGAPGRVSTFVCLGCWRKSDSIPLASPLLDLVEMYFCLILQTLPKGSLAAWLPHDVPVRKEVGLNVALPLIQSMRGSVQQDLRQAILQARRSDDAEVQSFFSGKLKPISAKGRQSMAAQNWIPNSQGMRRKSWKQQITRGPLLDRPGELNVEIICSRCKDPRSKRLDPDPLFLKHDGTYMARAQICKICPAKKSRHTGEDVHINPMHHPVDGRAKFSSNKLHTLKERLDW